MQKSTVNGSQGGSGVSVIVGATDGTAVGDGAVAVAMTFVFTTTRASVTGALAQDTRISNKKELIICFIKD
jgi:hypothetical protein